MKKKILTLSLAAIALMGFNAKAQDTAACPENMCHQAPCHQAPCHQAPCPDAPKGNFGPCDPACFEGITLTDAQKSEFKALNDKVRAERKDRMKAHRAQKQRVDSLARLERRAAKKSYLDGVKSILTPEQYTTFLENSYLNGGAKGKRGPAFKKGRHHGGHPGFGPEGCPFGKKFDKKADNK